VAESSKPQPHFASRGSHYILLWIPTLIRTSPTQLRGTGSTKDGGRGQAKPRSAFYKRDQTHKPCRVAVASKTQPQAPVRQRHRSVRELAMATLPVKLNRTFCTDSWTPRKIDKILWAFQQSSS
jgi:hypothetical protein